MKNHDVSLTPCIYLLILLGLTTACLSQRAPKASPIYRSLAKETPTWKTKAVPLSEKKPARSKTTHMDAVKTSLGSIDFPAEGIFKSQETYALELRGADLDHALNLIAEMGEANIFLEGDYSDPVDASFPKIKLDDAFRLLLEKYNCTLEHRDGITMVTRVDPQTRRSHIFTLRSASSPDLEANLSTLLGDEDEAVLSPEGDKVMVNVSTESLKRVAIYLDSVDQPEKQVILEARVVEVVLSDLFKVGTELDFGNISVDDTTSQILSSFFPSLSAGSNSATLSTTADKGLIDGALEVLKEFTRVEILSRPKVLAKNGAEAKIEVVEEIPYVDATTTTTGTSDGVGSTTVQEVEFKEVGLKLTVTPYIKGDNSVELKIVQDASEQMDTFLEIPVVDRRLVDTQLVVNDGELVIIGGLIKNETRDEESGIPILMDIPLLGYLFKSKSKVTQKRELLILITPTVIEGGSLPIPTADYDELLARNRGE